MPTSNISGSALARPNAPTFTTESNGPSVSFSHEEHEALCAAAITAGLHPMQAPALAAELGVGAGMPAINPTDATAQPASPFIAKRYQEAFRSMPHRPSPGGKIQEWEIIDRRCWPPEIGGGLDHYGIVVEADVPVRVGDLVWLDTESVFGDGTVDWVLARCTAPDTFIDLRTGQPVPPEKDPSVHGRVIRQSWWMSTDGDESVSEGESEREDLFVRDPFRVTLTDAEGKEVPFGFWASAPLYDSMAPACPRGEWAIFQSGDGAPSDIVLAGVEVIRRGSGFSSTTLMVIGRLGRDSQGRETLSSDSPGFAYTDGEMRDGVETHFAVWGSLVSFPVDTRELPESGCAL